MLGIFRIGYQKTGYVITSDKDRKSTPAGEIQIGETKLNLKIFKKLFHKEKLNLKLVEHKFLL